MAARNSSGVRGTFRKVRARLRPPRRFPPTREGWWFLVATLLVGAAAVNGGVNLLFLIFGMMLSLILASGILSELCLRNLTVTRRPPAAIHAGAPFLMGIAVRNGKRRTPSFSLEVEDLIDGRPVERRCYYLKIPAGRLQETAYRHTFTRRGVHRVSGLRLSTRFPFGFIRKSRDEDAPIDLVAYPALVPVSDGMIRAGLAEVGQRPTPRRSRSGEFHGLREYRPSDDPRDIHWRTSARRGRPFVREMEEYSGKTVVVALDDDQRADEDTDEASAAFEAAVSLTASVAVSLLKQGFEVGLLTVDAFLPPGRGPAQAAQILRRLAVLERRPSNALAEGDAPGWALIGGGAGGGALKGAVVRIRPGSTVPRFENAQERARSSA